MNEFPKKFEKSWLKEMRRKFGLTRIFSEDINIIDDFLKLMRIENLDFTLSFRNLSDLICETEKKNNFKLKNTKIIDEWILKWNKRLEKEKLGKSQIASEMKKINPLYIPRNHLVEAAINLAVNKKDYSEVRELLKIVRKPFSKGSFNKKYSLPPESDEIVSNTFCGT